MATMAPQMSGQSAWNHAVSTYGGVGEQHAGVGNTIAMKGGRRRRTWSKRQQSRKQNQSRKQRQSRKQSRRNQRGGRR